MYVKDNEDDEFFNNSDNDDEYLLFQDYTFLKDKKSVKLYNIMISIFLLIFAVSLLLSILIHVFLSIDVFLSYLSKDLHKGLIILNLIITILAIPYQLINFILHIYTIYKH